jgi:hypothetical protein
VSTQEGTSVVARRQNKPPRSLKRKVLLTLLVAACVYLLGTGPALWSRTRVKDRRWKKGVIYYVAPVMWLNYQFRERSTLEKLGALDLLPADDTRWYGWLESYWGFFGQETVSESRKVTLMLKVKFYGE